MKRIYSLKRIGTVALSFLLLFALASTALAADSSTVTFYGRTSLFGFNPADGSATGLFNNLQGLMPGGVYTQTIRVKNAYSQRTDIYLRGEPKGATPTGTDLLSKIKFTLSDEDGVIVDEGTIGRTWPTSGTSHDSEEYIDLGRFYEDDDVTLTLKLTVPADLGNEYQNAKGTVEWTFLANVYVPNDHPHNPDIPLSPPEIIIDNGQQIPLSPGTGDNTNLYLWAGGFVVLSLGLAVLIAKKRKVS